MNTSMISFGEQGGLLFAMVLIGALLAPFVSPAHAEMAPLIPLEDFFKNPETVGYSISPDGKKLAFLKPWNHRLNVYVKTIGTDEERRLTDATDRDIAGFFWKGNSKIVFVQDNGGDENHHVYIVSTEGGDPRDLTPTQGVKNYVQDGLREDPNHMLIATNQRNPQVFDIYRCEIETGKRSLIAENPGNIVGWMTDHDGQLRVATETDGVNQSILYRDKEGEPFQKLITLSYKDAFGPMMFTYDNEQLYVASNLGQDKVALHLYNPQSKQLVEKIYEHPDVDASRLISSRKRKKITGVAYVTDKTHYVFFDGERAALQKKLEGKFPDYYVVITEMDDDENRMIVGTYSDRVRGTYYLYDKKEDKIEKLAVLSPWLQEEQMAEMKPIQYTSRDGLTIHGYLTLPVGVPAKNLPLIVIPHGGPSSRDSWGFSATAQFLANRGAAVLTPNFRGSTGYGKKFWQAGFKQWGQAMQDDITDGVQWLISEGIADKKRVAIYGASYGGYAALAGATFTPDLYACAVSYVGPSSIFTLLESIPPYWEPLREMEYEMIGDPIKDKELLTKISPLYHADKIKIPLFVAQGANDPRVKKAESDQIVAAAKKKGVDVIYMVKDNEGHGFSNEENRLDFYRELELFLRRHLGLR